MNGVSGLAARFLPHGIHAGSLRDIAHIPAAEILGVANPAVAKAAGHDYNTLAFGTTDRCAGPINQDLNQLKMKHPYQDRSAPVKGAPLRKKTRVSTQEIDARLPDVPVDINNKENLSKRGKVGCAILKEREEERFRQATQHVNPPHLPALQASPNIQHPEPLSTHSASQQNANENAGRGYDEPTADTSFSLAPEEFRDVDMMLSLLANQSDLSNESIQAVIEDSIIDKASAEVIDDSRSSVGSNDNTFVDPLTFRDAEFVQYFSRINISTSHPLTTIHIQDFDDRCHMYIDSTNSRNQVTCFMYCCTHCHHQARKLGDHVEHERWCILDQQQRQEEKASHRYTCEYDGCNKRYTYKAGLVNHIQKVHLKIQIPTTDPLPLSQSEKAQSTMPPTTTISTTFVPQKCNEEGCKNETVFPTIQRLAKHIQSHRTIMKETLCLYPGCKSTTMWKSYIRYSAHLHREHRVPKGQRKNHLLRPLIAKNFYDTLCLVPRCTFTKL